MYFHTGGDHARALRLMYWQFIVLVQVCLRQNMMRPKFDPNGVQTHNLQIMDRKFHVPEMFALTT